MIRSYNTNVPRLPNNNENLFVHRLGFRNFQRSDPPDMRSTHSNTFWRSPYVGDMVGSGSKIMCMRPEITVTSPRFGSRDSRHIVESPNLTRSILKIRSPPFEECDVLWNNSQANGRPVSETPNLITTGTGKGSPHGSKVRPKTTGKRVKFDTVTQKSFIDVTRNPSTNTGTTFKGRRLFLDRHTSTRMLGSTNRSKATFQSRYDKPETASAVGVNGPESNIKSQIGDFIRKLRLAEIEKNGKQQIANSDELPVSHRNTAVKLRKPRPSVSIRPDWSEYDMDRIEKEAQSVNTRQPGPQEIVPDNSAVFEEGPISDNDSGSVSIESFESNKDESVVEKTPSGAKIFRPKPMPSLYTKYRHITSNEMHRYGRLASPDVLKYQETKGLPRNFCDSGKTDRILDWLQEVKTANAPEGVDT